MPNTDINEFIASRANEPMVDTKSIADVKRNIAIVLRLGRIKTVDAVNETVACTMEWFQLVYTTRLEMGIKVLTLVN